MKTLIIITLLLLVLTIVLIALIAKKFLDKTDHILASNALVSNNITDNAKKILDSLDAIEEKNNVIAKILEEIAKFNEHHRRVTEMLDNKIIAAKLKREEISNTVHNISDSIRIIRQNIEGSSGTKPELQKFNNKLIEFCDELNVIKQTLSNFDEVDCSRHQTIYDILKEIKNIAIEINNTTPNSEDIIDSDELVNRIAGGIYNKSTVLSEIDSVLKNLYDKINIIVAQVCSKTESIEIPDTLINSIAEEISKKLIEIQAKNSSSNIKTKKPSLHKAKTTGKLKTAVKQDNSQQERINEIAKQQNK